jgi:hypothetical protein
VCKEPLLVSLEILTSIALENSIFRPAHQSSHRKAAEAMAECLILIAAPVKTFSGSMLFIKLDQREIARASGMTDVEYAKQ